MTDNAKRVFISYSWAVQERVIELAERLIANGVDVVLDVYELKDGNDKYVFMERSVNDQSIDKVLIICDKTYSDKANNRKGGVGDETVIITPEIYGNTQQDKFIPIIFEKDEDGKPYCPQYIKSRIHIDLSDEFQYEAEFEKLLRDIYQKPLYKKPALGKKPEWLENEIVDLSAIRDIIKQIKRYSGDNPIKADFLLRRASDDFIFAAKEYMLPNDKPDGDGLLIAIDQYKTYRDLFVEYCEALIFSGFPVGETMGIFFENLYNGLHDTNGKVSYNEREFELADYMIWELFIDASATLLYYERFGDLHDLIVRPFFIKSSFMNEEVEASNYFRFHTYFETIEEVCKPKSNNPNLYSLAGNILVNREKRPILTKETISNADLVLYQLGSLLPIPQTKRWNSYWFPFTYIYHREPQNIWKKMISRSYCQKIAPLFGAKNLEQIKEAVKSSAMGRDIHYRGAWKAAPCILNSIKLEDIGTLQ